MKNDESILSRFMQLLKKNKKLELAIYICIGACILLLCLFTKGGEDKEARENEQTTVITESEIEERLSRTLSTIRGAGDVKVMVTYDTTAELVPAMSSTKQSGETWTDGSTSKNKNESNELATVNTGGEQEPVVLTEIQPKVRGVIVIAEGAADISVKMNLEYATATVLGIDADAIEIFEMQGSDG